MAAPRPLLKLGAVVFLLAMTGYSAALIYYNRLTTSRSSSAHFTCLASSKGSSSPSPNSWRSVS